MTSRSSHADRQRRYRERKQAGLKPVTAAWHWLTQAMLLDLASEAYEAASWVCRSPEVHPVRFIDELGYQLRARLAAAALDAGIEGCPLAFLGLRDQLVASLRELPADWRPQYPRFAAPQVGEPADHSDQVNTGAAKHQLVNDGAARKEVTPGPL